MTQKERAKEGRKRKRREGGNDGGERRTTQTMWREELAPSEGCNGCTGCNVCQTFSPFHECEFPTCTSVNYSNGPYLQNKTRALAQAVCKATTILHTAHTAAAMSLLGRSAGAYVMRHSRHMKQVRTPGMHVSRTLFSTGFSIFYSMQGFPHSVAYNPFARRLGVQRGRVHESA